MQKRRLRTKCRQTRELRRGEEGREREDGVISCGAEERIEKKAEKQAEKEAERDEEPEL